MPASEKRPKREWGGPPHTLEAYYQKAGRAGRDGHPTRCRVLWRPNDFRYGEIAAEIRNGVYDT